MGTKTRQQYLIADHMTTHNINWFEYEPFVCKPRRLAFKFHEYVHSVHVFLIKPKINGFI